MLEHYQHLNCDMKQEHWKIIKEFPNYQVSNYGNVKNRVTGKILKPLNSTNYYRVCLYDQQGLHKYVSIHRLVISYFVDNPYPNTLEYVNHIDENKHNNRADNLEWCTAHYNYNWSKDSAIKGSIKSAIERGVNKEIVVYNVWTQKAKLYVSTREVERQLNLNSGNMTPVLRQIDHKVLMSGKYMLFYRERWDYQNLQQRFMIMQKESRVAKHLVSLNLDTGEEQHFKSMREAEKSLGFPHQAISRVLNGNQVSTHGYKFKWDKQPVLPSKLPKLIVN